GGKDRYRFDDKGEGTFICTHCGSGKGIKLLQLYHGWRFPEAASAVADFLELQFDRFQANDRYSEYRDINGSEDNVHQRRLSKREIVYRRSRNIQTWAGGHPVSIGDPVDVYLQSRGIGLSHYPSALRFHPCLPYFDDDNNFIGNFPAMLALVTNPDGYGVCIHRTYLGNGSKANLPKPKKLMSAIFPNATKGASIKLFDPSTTELALAEGIETALSCFIATGIQAWATVSAWGMENVLLPASISSIVICVDNDKSGRGQEAALVLSRRLVAEGRKVRRIMPDSQGLDLNDVLLMEVANDC
ncbi:MAG TPA: toprim domain-containing protein, partial [Gammaproteobacteria bacterium]|nr:toprim domain-containing protein [Gammaproteobacteria bacterium]